MRTFLCVNVIIRRENTRKYEKTCKIMVFLAVKSTQKNSVCLQKIVYRSKFTKKTYMCIHYTHPIRWHEHTPPIRYDVLTLRHFFFEKIRKNTKNSVFLRGRKCLKNTIFVKKSGLSAKFRKILTWVDPKSTKIDYLKVWRHFSTICRNDSFFAEIGYFVGGRVIQILIYTTYLP